MRFARASLAIREKSGAAADVQDPRYQRTSDGVVDVFCTAVFVKDPIELELVRFQTLGDSIHLEFSLVYHRDWVASCDTIEFAVHHFVL